VEADGNEPRKIKVLKGKLNAERANATAFVVYDDAASARAATAALNMKEFEGRHIRVDLASKPSIIRSEVVYDHTRSVFLGHLPFNVDDEDVIRLFNKNKEYPDLRKSVEAVRVVRDRKTTMGKGIGFVLFKTPAQARTALLLDGSKLGDREIRVSKAARSKAPKPGTPSKARAEPKVATGAERRNPKLRDEGGDASTSRGTNAWEGSRSRPGGKSSKSAQRGGEAQRGAPGARQTSSKAGIAKAAKRSGKRPAVAARKAKAKASAAAGRN
jgi:nucleolar protein 12